MKYLIILSILIIVIFINYGCITNNIEKYTNTKDLININKYIDVVYYINLDHRTDRNTQLLNELSKTDITQDKIKRTSAIRDINNGALGCSKSHIKVLQQFINSNYTNCLILEDDFGFSQNSNIINDLFNKFFNSKINYDVIMLSSNTLKEKSTKYNFINKIIDAQTTSGYIVTKQFAPLLLQNYIEGTNLLQETSNKPMYSIDIHWKKLQPKNNWYVFNPKIGYQIESYSDIENKTINYKV